MKIARSFFIFTIMSKKIVITIDGFSSCGKSSLAKDLSKKIGYRYVDSGAMYRIVTLYCMQYGISVTDEEAVERVLKKISIDFRVVDGKNHSFLNGVDVEDKIRTMEVANKVSLIAMMSSVRSFLVAQQRIMGSNKAIVMDGRDIGTVVFPNALLKIFLTADPHIRALRRYEEMVNKKMNISMEEVEENLRERDRIDSTRSDSPLCKADDAIVIDNSTLSMEDQLSMALDLYHEVSLNLV